MFLIYFLLISFTVASKIPILSILISNCPYREWYSLPENCTYNYNIIKHYNLLCMARIITPNIGCRLIDINKHVIFNLYYNVDGDWIHITKHIGQILGILIFCLI